MTTELCKKLRDREDKPHIRIRCSRVSPRSYLWYSRCNNYSEEASADAFCRRVNPGSYPTPGQAARAWHNYKAD